jgi:hypothetical protein
LEPPIPDGGHLAVRRNSAMMAERRYLSVARLKRASIAAGRAAGHRARERQLRMCALPATLCESPKPRFTVARRFPNLSQTCM